jgi:hypothetical protein
MSNKIKFGIIEKDGNSKAVPFHEFIRISDNALEPENQLYDKIVWTENFELLISNRERLLAREFDKFTNEYKFNNEAKEPTELDTLLFKKEWYSYQINNTIEKWLSNSSKASVERVNILKLKSEFEKLITEIENTIKGTTEAETITADWKPNQTALAYLLVEKYPTESASSLAIKYGKKAGYQSEKNGYQSFRVKFGLFKTEGIFTEKAEKNKDKVNPTHLREAKEWLKNYDS